MPTTVDHRVVEMKFDNKQFEKDASQTINTLGSLNKSLQLENATKGLAGITEAAKKVDVSAISAGLRDINWVAVSVISVVQTVFRNITTAAMQAGRAVVNQFVNPIREGFQGYETKINATAVLMSSTKKSIKEVGKALQELNEYSDRTIYSFEDMTQNITKFTNAGVGLKDAVEIMKGIGNWAAISGAGMQQAAMIEYQLGQAMGSGVVRLQDWMSVQNAAMDTSRFKKELLDVALKMGTVKKAANGMYYAVGDGKKKLPFNENAKFRDSLEYQWLTTKVLTGALKNYASTETEIGKKANAAAADVKTFSQMMSTFADALKTSWIKSFELIFGNKDEATKFWTALSNAIGGVVGPINKTRNDILKLWKDLGGRAKVIEGFKNIFKSLQTVLGTIGDAFRDVFPKKTPVEILYWSRDFLEFTRKLIPSEKTLIALRKIFVGVFSAIELGAKALKFVANVIGSFISSMLVTSGVAEWLGETLTDVLVNIADFFTNLNEGTKEADTFATSLENIKKSFSKFGESIKSFLGSISFGAFGGKMGITTDGISDSFEKIKATLEPVVSWLSMALEKVGELFKNVFGNFGNVLKTAFAGGGLYLFGKFVFGILQFINQGPAGFSNVMMGITNALDGLKKRISAETLNSVAKSLLILAAALVVMSMVPADRLEPVMMALSALMIQVVAIMASFDKMDGGVKGIVSAAFALNLIGTALLIMASALKVLATLKPEALTMGIEAIAALLLIFAAFGKLISDGNSGIVAAGFAMFLLAGGLAVLGGALKIFATMKLEEIQQGLMAITGALFVFAAFSKMADPKGLLAAGAGLVGIAFAMVLLGGVIKLLGTMDTNQLGISMLALAGTLVMMGFAINMFPTDGAARAAGILIMATAITMIAKAMAILGGLSLEQVGIGLLALFGALGMMVVALNLMKDPGMLLGAAAIIIVSMALLVLAKAMTMMGNLSWEDLAKGLVALAGALVIIGVAGYLLTGAAIGLIALGAAFLLVGAGVALAGAGIAALGVGLTAIAAVVGTGGLVILNFLKEIAATLPIIMYNFGKALVSFFMGIAENWGQMSVIILKLLAMIIDLIIQLLPKVFVVIGQLLDGILDIIAEYAPKIGLTFMGLLMTWLTMIEIFLPLLIEKAGNIVVSFINGMSRYYNKIITAGTNFIINLIRGISRNMLRIVNAAAETILSFINGLTKAVDKYGPRINTAMRGLISAVFRAALDAIGLYKFVDIGSRVVDGIAKGINKAVDGPLKAIKKIIDAIIFAAKKAGIIKSPSRRSAAEIGAPIVMGIAKGMIDNTKAVMSVATNVVESAYAAMSQASNRAADVFSNVSEPKITPVVDLSNVYKSAASISSLMGNRAMSISGSVGGSIGQTTNGGLAAGSQTNNDIKLIQNNYSPKALNRLELYRQTNNLVSRLRYVKS